MIFVYTLSEPGSTVVRYVGITRNLIERVRNHLSNRAAGAGTHKANWLLSLKLAGLKPEVRVVDVAWDDADAGTLERKWIQFYKARGCHLTNYTAGGGNPVHWSEETRKQLSEKVKGKSYFSILNKQRIGQPFSEAHRRNLGLASAGRTLNVTPEARKRKGEAMVSRMAEPANRAKQLAARAEAEPRRVESLKVAGLKKRGVPLSEEHRQKAAEAARKFTATPEYRQKMSEIKKGKVVTIMTPEIKAKISQTLKAKFANGELAEVFERRTQTNKRKGQHNNGQKRIPNVFSWLRGSIAA